MSVYNLHNLPTSPLDQRPLSPPLEEFEAQTPLRLDGRVVWCREAGNNTMLGVEFQNPTPDQQHRLEQCFGHFKKNARYAEFEQRGIAA